MPDVLQILFAKCNEKWSMHEDCSGVLKVDRRKYLTCICECHADDPRDEKGQRLARPIRYKYT